MQAQRNSLSKDIGRLKAKSDETAAASAVAGVTRSRSRCPRQKQAEREKGMEIEALLATIPNLPAPDVPDGADESANKEIRRHGETPRLNKPLQHFELGEALGLMDFGRAAKISGARFVVLKGALARLERALGAFMLDLHTRRIRLSRSQPAVAGRATRHCMGTGQLPKFAEDLFRDQWRPLADPHRRSAADQSGQRRDPRRGGAAAALHRADTPVSAPKRGRPARTRAA